MRRGDNRRAGGAGRLSGRRVPDRRAARDIRRLAGPIAAPSGRRGLRSRARMACDRGGKAGHEPGRDRGSTAAKRSGSPTRAHCPTSSAWRSRSLAARLSARDGSEEGVTPPGRSDDGGPGRRDGGPTRLWRRLLHDAPGLRRPGRPGTGDAMVRGRGGIQRSGAASCRCSRGAARSTRASWSARETGMAPRRCSSEALQSKVEKRQDSGRGRRSGGACRPAAASRPARGGGIAPLRARRTSGRAGSARGAADGAGQRRSGGGPSGPPFRRRDVPDGELLLLRGALSLKSGTPRRRRGVRHTGHGRRRAAQAPRPRCRRSPARRSHRSRAGQRLRGDRFPGERMCRRSEHLAFRWKRLAPGSRSPQCSPHRTHRWRCLQLARPRVVRRARRPA